MNRSIWACAAGGLVLVMLGFVGGCETNATTGRSQFNTLSRDEEVALGASEGPKLTQEFGGEVPNASLRGYITEVGLKLKDQTEVDGPQRQWVFTLLDSDVINAFALPGERVFMSRGLADKLTSEAELAGVLGHEIGHVMARHSSERIGQAGGASILAGAAAVIAGVAIDNDAAKVAVPAIVGAGGQMVVLKFSRDQESEADSLGMRYMAKAGYNPRGQLEVMRVLERESGSGGGMEMLATHPLPSTRIDRVQNELKTTYAYTQSGPQAQNYQDFKDRYQQRYLSIRATEPKKAAPAPAAKPGSGTPPAQLKGQKRGELPVDERGRSRMLAAISLDDPTTWCSVCKWNAEHGIAVEVGH